MGGFRIEQVKNKETEIKSNIENKKKEYDDLSATKEKLMDAGFEVQSSDIDDNVKNTIMEMINAGLNENSEKGDKLSCEMNSDLEALQDLKDDTRQSLDSNLSETEKLQKKKEWLDKIGIGGVLDNSISELQENQKELENLTESMLETERELMDVAHRLNSL